MHEVELGYPVQLIFVDMELHLSLTGEAEIYESLNL